MGLDGQPLDGVPLIERLNELGGQHGVGRIDHVENRLVGIKSRELYEAPAAVILHEAHRELESLCLSKQAQRFKTLVSQEYADIIYNGLWFSAFHQDLFAFVASNQRFVAGQVRVKLFKGKATVVGRKSEHSLYSKKLATYESGDSFDHDAARGFHSPVGSQPADAGAAAAAQGRQGLRSAGAARAARQGIGNVTCTRE